MKQAKREAARRGTTLTDLIEEGLRLVMATDSQPAKRASVEIPVSSAQGGTLPGVDLRNSRTLLDIMEGRV